MRMASESVISALHVSSRSLRASTSLKRVSYISVAMQSAPAWRIEAPRRLFPLVSYLILLLVYIGSVAYDRPSMNSEDYFTL